MSITGVVLVGGQSRRFGSPKHAIELGNETLLQRSCRILRTALDSEPLIVGGREMPDQRADCGPLGGIETAFSSTQSGSLLILACDMPAVSHTLIRYLAEHPSPACVLVPTVNGQRHPLCARWERSIQLAVSAAMDANQYSVLRLLDSVNAQSVDAEEMRKAGVDPERELCNVNRPEDLLNLTDGGGR